MLGEAARTEADAKYYHLAYSRAISAIADHCVHGSVAENPAFRSNSRRCIRATRWGNRRG